VNRGPCPECSARMTDCRIGERLKAGLTAPGGSSTAAEYRLTIGGTASCRGPNAEKGGRLGSCSSAMNARDGPVFPIGSDRGTPAFRPVSSSIPRAGPRGASAGEAFPLYIRGPGGILWFSGAWKRIMVGSDAAARSGSEPHWVSAKAIETAWGPVLVEGGARD